MLTLHEQKQMKLRIEESRWAVCLACMVLSLTVGASADVIRRTITYPSNAIAAWASIDFDGDTTPELSFESYGVGNESGGVMFLDVHGPQSTQVLLQDWRVLPLQLGDTVSLTPVMGQWQTTSLQNSVWTTGLLSSPEAPPLVPAQGVGMPGYGDFMGVRFLDGIDWHYAWVRFGPLNASFYPGWPSVLEYAYETFPNTPIVVPEPSAGALILSGCVLFCFYARQKTMA